MNITTARAALSSAAPAMMLFDISPAANVERSSATLDGKANIAQNVSIPIIPIWGVTILF